MTTHLIKADPLAWELAMLQLKAAKANCDAIEMPRDDAILDATLDRYYEAEEALLDLPAPSIEAVISKLMLIWADEIPSEAHDAHQKRMVIGDLRRFQVLNRLK